MNTTLKTYMFPGQGSQEKQMGAGLFERFPRLVDEADDILGYSIRALCLDDPREELGKTQFTQPALYVVNALSYLSRVEEAGQPDFLAGHSLGEFNALMAAGCFDFATGLRLVQKRGELMSQVSGGAMAAIVNATSDHISAVLQEHGLHNVYMANFNSPLQTVISGLHAEVAEAEQYFQMQGKMRFYPLATSGAFHSAYMREAMAQFRAFLEGVQLAAPRIPVLANVTARPYQAEAMLDTLASQIASTVRWSDSIRYLLALAHMRGLEAEFIECGHGDVLTRMVFMIKAQTPQAELDEFIRLHLGDQEGAAEPAGAEAKVAAFRRRYSVGSRMKSRAPGYGELVTRTDAMVLFGHRAAVYMEGYKGYFDLDELTAA